MHDPLTVAFTIPNLLKLRRQKEYDYDPKGGSVLKKYRWHWFGTHAFVVWGKAFGFHPLITVWHREPGGKDSGEVCKHYYSLHTKHEWAPDGEVGKPLYEHFIIWTWKLHVHHWRLQIHPYQNFRRRVLTRCAWCGGRSVKGDPVNISHQWDSPKKPWWQGEKGLFHHDCSTVERAHNMCLCAPEDRVLEQWDYGHCQCCGKFYGYNSNPDWGHRALADLPKGSRIPLELKKRLEVHWKEKNKEARKN